MKFSKASGWKKDTAYARAWRRKKIFVVIILIMVIFHLLSGASLVEGFLLTISALAVVVTTWQAIMTLTNQHRLICPCGNLVNVLDGEEKCSSCFHIVPQEFFDQ